VVAALKDIINRAVGMEDLRAVQVWGVRLSENVAKGLVQYESPDDAHHPLPPHPTCSHNPIVDVLDLVAPP
jgi:hypothetical protein